MGKALCLMVDGNYEVVQRELFSGSVVCRWLAIFRQFATFQ